LLSIADTCCCYSLLNAATCRYCLQLLFDGAATACCCLLPSLLLLLPLEAILLLLLPNAFVLLLLLLVACYCSYLQDVLLAVTALIMLLLNY